MFVLCSSKDMFIDFRWRRREREWEREILMLERNIDLLPPICSPTWDWTYDLGMCPDQGLNPQPFGEQYKAPTNWSTCSGLFLFLLVGIICVSSLWWFRSLIRSENISATTRTIIDFPHSFHCLLLELTFRKLHFLTVSCVS